MKDEYPGNAAFSVLEIIVAMGFIVMVITAAALSDFGARYWVIASQTNAEAIDRVTEEFETIRAGSESNFFGISEYGPRVQIDTACLSGGLCYWIERVVDDISECVKRVEVRMSWRVPGFPTSTTYAVALAPSARESLVRGGDCELAAPTGDWGDIGLVQSVPVSPSAQFTEIDALGYRIYLSSNRSPYIWGFDISGPAENDLVPIAIENGFTFASPSNSIDVIRDLSTGRTYAFAAQTTTTPTIVISDVTDMAHPAIVKTIQLQGTHRPAGSFPQTWLVRVFKNRLYVFTRETAGFEFHIIDISSFDSPIEIGAGFELNRTVNDAIVREQVAGNSVHRFVYLAAKAGLKEIAVLDVTNDAISEVGVVDLPGTQDMRSLYISGNALYVGRDSSVAGPELYVFDITEPSHIASSSPITAEVGSAVISLRKSGNLLLIGTNTRIESWTSEPLRRIATRSVTGLIPHALELRATRVFMAAAGGLYELHDD